MKAVLATMAVALAAAACGGGGEDDEVGAETFRLDVAPGTTSTYVGTIEVCPAQWYAPRRAVLGATIDYAPQAALVVYVNYREVDNPAAFVVYQGDGVYVCARMPAPLTVLSGSATLEVKP